MYNTAIYYTLSIRELLCSGLFIFILLMQPAALRGQDTEILYRVNAGGEKVEAKAMDWEADFTATSNHGEAKKGTPSPYYTITNVNGQDLAFAIPSFTGKNKNDKKEYPNQLFATERFTTFREKVSQTWDFPVSVAGTYTINLLFAEIWDGAQEPGKRIFGIAIEDSIVTDSIDLVTDPGWNEALIKTYEMVVEDGNIDINLLRIVQNPTIKGIEIIGPAGANINLPPQFVNVPLVRGEAGETLNATFTTLEKDGDAIALSLIVNDQNGNSIDPALYTFTDNGDGTGTLVWETLETDIFFYNATITASDKDGADTRDFNIIVSEKIDDILYRVNAGGPAVEDALDQERPSFSADPKGNPSPYGSGGDTYLSSNPVSVNTSVPAYVPLSLFQSERFWSVPDGDEGKWSFDVPDGKLVSVRLFLSEIFLTAEGVNSNENKGPRKFDVMINEDTVDRAIDVFAEVGGNVGIMRTYSVISNGKIDVSFGALSENPSIKGIEIIGVEPITVNINKVDAACFGGLGSATVEVSGGLGPYEIIWADGASPDQLLAGTYSVIIKDGSGQEKEEEVTIGQPEPLTVTIETTDASAIGASDGKAVATVAGGAGPYTLDWGEGINPEALPAGNYSPTVTDANGCSTGKDFVIGDPNTLIVNVETTNPSCFGGTGTAAVTATGGSEPYTIEWADEVDPDALPAGEYTVTVTDNAGKQVEKKIAITQPETALDIVANTTDASAFGAADGSANLSVSGGTSPYNIFWGDIDPNAIAAGSYMVKVKDAAGCEKEVEFSIGEPAKLTAEITKTDATCEAPGSATVAINGGTFPYLINWSDDADPENLDEGTYQVTIIDANDVRIVKEVIIILDCDEPVGTEDPVDENMMLNLYPVPGNGILHVSVPASLADQDAVIKIYTIYGQNLYQQKANTRDVATVNAGSLSKGTYILEVQTKGKVLKRRFVIK